MLASGGMEEDRKMGGRLSKGYTLPVMTVVNTVLYVSKLSRE